MTLRLRDSSCFIIINVLSPILFSFRFFLLSIMIYLEKMRWDSKAPSVGISCTELGMNRVKEGYHHNPKRVFSILFWFSKFINCYLVPLFGSIIYFLMVERSIIISVTSLFASYPYFTARNFWNIDSSELIESFFF